MKTITSYFAPKTKTQSKDTVSDKKRDLDSKQGEDKTSTSEPLQKKLSQRRVEVEAILAPLLEAEKESSSDQSWSKALADMFDSHGFHMVTQFVAQ